MDEKSVASANLLSHIEDLLTARVTLILADEHELVALAEADYEALKEKVETAKDKIFAWFGGNKPAAPAPAPALEPQPVAEAASAQPAPAAEAVEDEKAAPPAGDGDGTEA